MGEGKEKKGEKRRMERREAKRGIGGEAGGVQVVSGVGWRKMESGGDARKGGGREEVGERWTGALIG